MSRTATGCLATAAGLLTALLVAPQTLSAQQTVGPDAVDVQGRGPVHDAFALPFEPNPQPGALVPRPPPAPVPEEPPEQRPEGDNVQWVPGYWAWDAERNDFLWVSGVWRNAPVGERYVAGSWQQEGDGWRWVPGFWNAAGQTEPAYNPPPPASLDNGPSVPPPDDASVYSPGYWFYRQTRYVWRPGFWRACRPGLVWVPAHYVWTPGGCIFVAGYWDYPLEERGVLFAPVIFRRPLWRTAGWVYRPAYVVEPAALLDCLFVGPRAGSYYFGDYYRQTGPRGGFTAWINYGPRRYDPLFSYYRFTHRRDPGWAAGLRRTYADRVAGRATLPPRTLAQQNTAFRGGSRPLLAPLTRMRSPALRRTTTAAAQRRAPQRLRPSATTMRSTNVRRSTSAAVVARPGRPAARTIQGRQVRQANVVARSSSTHVNRQVRVSATTQRARVVQPAARARQTQTRTVTAHSRLAAVVHRQSQSRQVKHRVTGARPQRPAHTRPASAGHKAHRK